MFLKFQIGIFIFLSCFVVQAEQEDQEELNRRLLKAIRMDAVDGNVRSDPGLSGLLNYHINSTARKIYELLGAGADPNAQNENGLTSLHAVRYPKLAKILLRAGANPNAKTKEGLAPLCYRSEYPVAKLLVEYGADPNVACSDGKTPWVVKRYPKLLDLSQKPKQGASCRYITPDAFSQINAAQCSERSICIARVFCVFEAGMDPHTTQIAKNIQVVCSSLPNGQCPSANDCLLDRSVVEKKAIADSGLSSNEAVPRSSSRSTKAVR